MVYRKLPEKISRRMTDDQGVAFQRTTPPSWRTPFKPVVDIVPAIPSKTDQEDRQRELKKRLKPIQYPSKDSPDRGMSYYDVYPVSRKGPNEGQGEMAHQPFKFMNNRDDRGRRKCH